jgi:hypothetical protein
MFQSETRHFILFHSGKCGSLPPHLGYGVMGMGSDFDNSTFFVAALAKRIQSSEK